MEPISVATELSHLQNSFGLAALGVIVFVVVVRVIVWACSKIYRDVIILHQEGQKTIADARVREAEAMTKTAVSLDSTARELSVAASVQKETAKTQRVTTDALGEQIRALTAYRGQSRSQG